MALPLNNTFEGGSDGTAITTANSGGGSGDPFDVVATGGTSAVEFDSLRAAHGTLSAFFDINGADGVALHWESGSVGTQTEIWIRAYIYRTAIPGAQQRHLRLRNSSGSDTVYSVIHTDGDVYIFDAAGGFSQVVTNLPLNEWVRLEYHLIAHTSTGTWEVRMYQGDSTTILDSASRTGVNTGADVAQVRFGSTTTVNAGDFWLDDLQVNNTGWPGPVAEIKLRSQHLDYDYSR